MVGIHFGCLLSHRGLAKCDGEGILGEGFEDEE